MAAGTTPCTGKPVQGVSVLCPVVCAVSLVLVLLFATAGTAFARVVPDPVRTAVFHYDDPPTAQTVQRNGVSLQQATVLATRRFPGRVVRAETVVTGGRSVHVIRILGENNRVRTVRIDADTGNFLQ